MLITITGVSGSGKSTARDILVEKYGYFVPFEVTTREERKSDNLMVSIPVHEFLGMLEDGDLLEFVGYNGNWYGIEDKEYNFINEDYIVIVTPEGREQLRRYAVEHEIPFAAIFLKCELPTQKKRLSQRGDKEADIDRRLRDRLYFMDALSDRVIHVDTITPDKLADKIHKYIQSLK